MKNKHSGIIALMNVFLTCAMAVFVSYIVIQLGQAALTVPFRLPEETVVFTVSKVGPVGTGDVESIANHMVDLLKKSNTTLVYLDSDYGIGVYDPAGYFASQPLVLGDYFALGDFGQRVAPVLVKLDSPMHRMLSHGSTIVNGAVVSVKGVYGKAHALFTRGQSYIFSFLSTASLEGTYYFSSNSDAVGEVLALLGKNGYRCSAVLATQSGWSALRNMYSVMIAAGLTFICFNCFLAYYLLLSRYESFFSIHLRFGATKRTLLAGLLTVALPASSSGSMLGVSMFAVTFRSYFEGLTSSLVWIPIAVAVSIASSVLLIIIAFLTQRFWAAKVGQL
ncbi:MAG: hypothetical protein Q8S19_09385 [Bacillota bacterium]|nr:hypothetical protein [Bacillota bacterium]